MLCIKYYCLDVVIRLWTFPFFLVTLILNIVFLIFSIFLLGGDTFFVLVSSEGRELLLPWNFVIAFVSTMMRFKLCFKRIKQLLLISELLDKFIISSQYLLIMVIFLSRFCVTGGRLASGFVWTRVDSCVTGG